MIINNQGKDFTLEELSHSNGLSITAEDFRYRDLTLDLSNSDCLSSDKCLSLNKFYRYLRQLFNLTSEAKEIHLNTSEIEMVIRPQQRY